jgi:hypothetical protein
VANMRINLNINMYHVLGPKFAEKQAHICRLVVGT